MSYLEKVSEKIEASGQRVDERKTLWQTLASSFEQEGPDAVERHLRNLSDAIQEKVYSTLAKLEEML